MFFCHHKIAGLSNTLLITISFLILIIPETLAQKGKQQTFDYEKKSKQHGSFYYQYQLSDGKNTWDLHERNGEVNLNEPALEALPIETQLFIIININDVKFGLKGNYKDSKDADHNSAYGLEVNLSSISNPEGLILKSNKGFTVRPTDKNNNSGQLRFEVNRKIKEQNTGTISIPYQVVGAVSATRGGPWLAGKLALSYAISPSETYIIDERRKEAANQIFSSIQQAQNENNEQLLKKHCDNYIKEFPSLNKFIVYEKRYNDIEKLYKKLINSNDSSTPTSNDPEAKLLKELRFAIEEGDENKILDLCRRYRYHYREEKIFSGSSYEKVLCLMYDRLSDGLEKEDILKSLTNLYPKSACVKSDNQKGKLCNDCPPPPPPKPKTESEFIAELEEEFNLDNLDSFFDHFQNYGAQFNKGLFKDTSYYTKRICDLKNIQKDSILKDSLSKLLESLNPMHSCIDREIDHVLVYTEPSGEITITSDGIVISNVEGGIPPYSIRAIQIEGQSDDNFSPQNQSSYYKFASFESAFFKMKFSEIKSYPEGHYMIYVEDSNNKIFIKENKVYIKPPVNTSWLLISIILILLGGIYWLYKKYIVI